MEFAITAPIQPEYRSKDFILDHIRAKISIFKRKAKPAIYLTLGEFRLLRNPDIAIFFSPIWPGISRENAISNEPSPIS